MGLEKQQLKGRQERWVFRVAEWGKPGYRNKIRERDSGHRKVWHSQAFPQTMEDPATCTGREDLAAEYQAGHRPSLIWEG